MPIFNTGNISPASKLFNDSSYRSILEGLGITNNSNKGGRFNLPGIPDIGLTYLRSPEGAQSLFSLFSQQAPNGSRRNLTSRKFSDIYTQYKAAAAFEPTLQFDQFLDRFDIDRLYDLSSFQERGERPNSYSRGYRLVGG